MNRRVLYFILLILITVISSIIYAEKASYDGLTDLYNTGHIFCILVIVCCVLFLIPTLKEYRQVSVLCAFLCPLIYLTICSIRPNYDNEPYAKCIELEESSNSTYSICYNIHFGDFRMYKWELNEATGLGHVWMSITGKIEKHNECIFFVPDEKSINILNNMGEYEMVKSFEKKEIYVKTDSIYGLLNLSNH